MSLILGHEWFLWTTYLVWPYKWPKMVTFGLKSWFLRLNSGSRVTRKHPNLLKWPDFSHFSPSKCDFSHCAECLGEQQHKMGQMKCIISWFKTLWWHFSGPSSFEDFSNCIALSIEVSLILIQTDCLSVLVLSEHNFSSLVTEMSNFKVILRNFNNDMAPRNKKLQIKRTRRLK